MTYVLDYMRDKLAGHVLHVVADTPEATIYRLGPPGEPRRGTTIVLLHDAPQVILTGDLHPGDGHALAGPRGYGLPFFGAKLGESYLCDKFLRRVFVPSYAHAALLDAAIEMLDAHRVDDIAERDFEAPQHAFGPNMDARFRAIDEALHDEERGRGSVLTDERAFYDFWVATFGEGPEGEAYGYDPANAGWLCAIQQRFAACLCEHCARGVPEVGPLCSACIHLEGDALATHVAALLTHRFAGNAAACIGVAVPSHYGHLLSGLLTARLGARAAQVRLFLPGAPAIAHVFHAVTRFWWSRYDEGAEAWWRTQMLARLLPGGIETEITAPLGPTR